MNLEQPKQPAKLLAPRRFQGIDELRVVVAEIAGVLGEFGAEVAPQNNGTRPNLFVARTAWVRECRDNLLTSVIGS